MRGNGSSECVARALRGYGGISSMASSARVHAHEALAAQTFSRSRGLAMYHDGSTHNGFDVVLGAIVVIEANKCAYLIPTAPPQHTHTHITISLIHRRRFHEIGPSLNFAFVTWTTVRCCVFLQHFNMFVCIS